MAVSVVLLIVRHVAQASADYLSGPWRNQFDKEEQAQSWKQKKPDIGVSSPFAATVLLFDGALQFLAVRFDSLHVGTRCLTVDATQGATFEAVVVAAPDDSQSCTGGVTPWCRCCECGCC